MIEIRYILAPDDLGRMMEIERLSFNHPWDEADVRDGILSKGKIRFMGAYESDTLIGWGAFSVFLNEAHLLTIAVHPDFRQQGIGDRLLNGILQASADVGAQYMELECRRSNERAKAFYNSHGFMRVGVSKGYYTDTGEDALIFVKIGLPEGDCERDPFLIREED